MVALGGCQKKGGGHAMAIWSRICRLYDLKGAIAFNPKESLGPMVCRIFAPMDSKMPKLNP
jgi:hypothetical protein